MENLGPRGTWEFMGFPGRQEHEEAGTSLPLWNLGNHFLSLSLSFSNLSYLTGL